MLKRAGQNVISQLASVLVSILDRVLVIGLLLRYWGSDRFSDWSRRKRKARSFAWSLRYSWRGWRPERLYQSGGSGLISFSGAIS
jgi:hypothetical protein